MAEFLIGFQKQPVLWRHKRCGPTSCAKVKATQNEYGGEVGLAFTEVMLDKLTQCSFLLPARQVRNVRGNHRELPCENFCRLRQPPRSYGKFISAVIYGCVNQSLLD